MAVKACIYIHAHAYICKYVYAHVYMFVCTSIRQSIHTYTDDIHRFMVNLFLQLEAYTYDTYQVMATREHIRMIYTCAHIHIHTIHTSWWSTSALSFVAIYTVSIWYISYIYQLMVNLLNWIIDTCIYIWYIPYVYIYTYDTYHMYIWCIQY